jgi:hypothetical protein
MSIVIFICDAYVEYGDIRLLSFLSQRKEIKLRIRGKS